MSVRYMPFPVHDTLPCMKGVTGEKTEAVMKRIQDLIYRNSLPKKTASGQQAFRLQQEFLLGSAQQTVDKLISQTLEGVKLLRKNELNSPTTDSSHQEVITQAENLIQDSEKAKQLLLSLHEMIEQKGEAGKVIERKLQQLSDDLYSVLAQHIQGNIDNVLQLTEEKCPHLMGDESVKEEIKKGCFDKSSIAPDFVRHCVMDVAGTDIVNKLNEVHLAISAHISDKIVDRAIDSLMKCHRNLNDVSKKRSSTPDVLKTRLRSSPSDLSKELTETVSMLNESNCTPLSDQSPLATPQMRTKRTGLLVRRTRPKSVVDCIEGISADDIPDLLPSLPTTIEENSALHDLPPVSPQQLKHLGKARPKKPKTRAPTRPSLRTTAEINEEAPDIQEGIDGFFRPGSTTPTPIVTPDSDECSTSLMISMTSNNDDSIQSTPTHSSRTFKVDDKRSDNTSPGSFDSLSVCSKLSLDPVPRSKSTDCLEKPSGKSPSTPTGDENDGQKSPVQKIGVSMGSSVVAEMRARQEKRTSVLLKSDENSVTVTSSNSPASGAITTGVSVSAAKEKFNNSQKEATSAVNVNRRPPPVAPKPRPWSVVSADRKSGEYSLGSDGSSPNSSANTPDSGELLEDSSGDNAGKVSPLTLVVTGNADKVGAGSPSATSNFEMASLSQSNSPPKNNFVSNHNLGPPLSLLSATNNHSSTTNGPISINLRSSVSTNGNDLPSSDINSSPLSLPSWGVSEKSGRSVKELAASLARQQSATEPEIKKKADSLPRNVPASSVEPQKPDFNRAKVSIQEWSRQQSVPEVWKVARKFSAEKPITKRWDSNSEQKTSNGLGLRKTGNDEDVVNV